MEKFSEELQNWYSIISSVEKIDLSTAKKLYTDIQNETKETKKNNIREELINKTLYVVYNFISKNDFQYLNSRTYDLDDIISICNEIWINMIDSGKLLKVDKFSQMFDYQFYSELTEKLIVNKYQISEITILDIEIFADLLFKFIEEKSNSSEFKYNDFIELIINESQHNYKYKNIVYKIFKFRDYCVGTYELLNCIYKSLRSDENVTISKTKLHMFKYILLNNGLDFLLRDLDNVQVDDIANSIINDMHYQDILSLIFDGDIINEDEKSILKRRFGIGIFNCHTLDEISKQDGLTKERIRQKESKAIRKLRGSKGLRILSKI